MRILKVIRGVMDQVLVWVNIGLFAFMVVIGTYQILVRYLFNRPSTVSEELLTYAFAWMSLLAATYVFGKRGHMRMGFLADKVTGSGRLALELVIEGLVFAFDAVVMVYGGCRITSLTMSQKTASLGIPMGTVYGIVPVCGVLVMVYSLINMLQMPGEGRACPEPEVQKLEEASGEDAAESKRKMPEAGRS